MFLQAVAPPLDGRATARAARKAAPDTAGRHWFDLPATPITPQVPSKPYVSSVVWLSVRFDSVKLRASVIVASSLFSSPGGHSDTYCAKEIVCQVCGVHIDVISFSMSYGPFGKICGWVLRYSHNSSGGMWCRQLKTDLRLLALRGAFDPKRFYRNPDATKFPKYFQMGTVVEGPTDFYSGGVLAFPHHKPNPKPC